MMLERWCKGVVIIDMRVDKILAKKVMVTLTKRRKKAVRSEQKTSPSIYASAKPISLARRIQRQAERE